MAATLTIGTVTYPDIAMIEDKYDQLDNLQERGRFQCDVIDYTGNHFVKGESVTVVDPVLGVIFNGFLNTDKEVTEYPSGYILHTIDCIGMHYLADKRTYTNAYTTSSLAGKIVVDQLAQVLVEEGIVQNFAVHEDTTQQNFAQGNLTGTQGTTNLGDGDLELAQSGVNVTIVEGTTAVFATGTLTNVVATNNELIPTTQSGLELSVVLPTPNTGAFCEITFWTGSLSIGVSDTLNYDIWIASTSPVFVGNVFLYFSDNTSMVCGAGFLDQNGVDNCSLSDLSNYAKDQWYTRNVTLASISGKTAVRAVTRFAGTGQGTYTYYYKNIYIGSHSGAPLFGTAATTTVVNPLQMTAYNWYLPSSIVATLLPVMNPATTSRISPTYTISTVGLLSSSSVVWSAATPSNSGFFLFVSYDGGASYTNCTNSAPLPALPAGSNLSSASLVFKETFGVGTNPSSIPSLEQLTVSLISAPNATKSDIISNFITQTQWNTGTFSSLTATVSGQLTLGTLSQNWSGGPPSVTTYFPSGNVTAAISGGVYTMTSTVIGSASDGFGNVQLNFCGSQILNFVLDIDMKFGNTLGDVGITFRDGQNSWQTSVNNTFAYAVTFTGTAMTLYGGTNGSVDGINTLATAAHTMSTNTLYHLKLVVNGLNFQCYWNHEGTPSINFTDTTFNYLQPGGIGFRMFNHNSGSQTVGWDNLVFSPAPFGTWTSPSISLSSLVTAENSSIFWTQAFASDPSVAYIQVSTSLDGGSTYQLCTSNNQIPMLVPGYALTGKNLLIQIFMSSIDEFVNQPYVAQLVTRVLGAYPGSSGTRTTAPMGNDLMIRANQSGWGTAFDGQTWVKTGVATAAIVSNEATLTNTTGDAHEVLGARTWTDEDITVRFQLSSSSIFGGAELRYTDVNNFYRLQVSTTLVSIVKKSLGATYTLASVAMTISTGVWYRMRFRVVGSYPTTLFGNIWLDGTLEPTINPTNGLWSAANWTITAAD